LNTVERQTVTADAELQSCIGLYSLYVFMRLPVNENNQTSVPVCRQLPMCITHQCNCYCVLMDNEWPAMWYRKLLMTIP